MTVFDNIFRGAGYVIRGCREFYADRKAWKYVLFPWLLLLAVYAFAFRGVFALAGWGADYLKSLTAELPDWLAWLGGGLSGIATFIGIVTAIFLLSMTVSTLYEMFGGLFFDSLIAYHERKEFGNNPSTITWKENFIYIFDTCCFGLKSALIFIIMLSASLFIPFIGKTIICLVMGYYFGISYMITPGNMHGIRVAALRKQADNKSMVVWGFGVTVYLLFLIPFAVLFLLPGVVLGGSDLFNNEIKGQ